MSSPFDKYIWQMSDSAKLSAEEIRRLHAGLATDRAESIAGEQFVRELLRLEKLTPTQAASLLQAVNPGVELGEYLLLERLGQSRSAMIFRAEHRRLKRIVALKILAPHRLAQPGIEQRIAADARRQIRLIHPHLVATWGLEQSNGLHLLATEHVDGTDLQHFVQLHGPLPVAQAVEYCRQAAKALDYLHSRGVVHRHVEPSHLLLDDLGQIRLLGARLFGRDDMGGVGDAMLSGPDDPELSAPTSASVAYLAPEQVVDEEHADLRSDLYGLGCTLFFLLTGRQPYLADSVVRQILAHRQQPIPPLGSIIPGGTDELDAVFQKMVAKRPEERFASVDELLEALAEIEPPASESVFDSDPQIILPQPSPPPYREPASYREPMTREQMERETTEVRLLAKDDGTIMEMSVQSVREFEPAASRVVSGRPRPPQSEPRVWLILLMLVASITLVLGLVSWIVVSVSNRPREVRASQVVVHTASAGVAAPTARR